jgi:hypothetical protein
LVLVLMRARRPSTVKSSAADGGPWAVSSSCAPPRRSPSGESSRAGGRGVRRSGATLARDVQSILSPVLRCPSHVPFHAPLSRARIEYGRASMRQAGTHKTENSRTWRLAGSAREAWIHIRKLLLYPPELRGHATLQRSSNCTAEMMCARVKRLRSFRHTGPAWSAPVHHKQGRRYRARLSPPRLFDQV